MKTIHDFKKYIVDLVIVLVWIWVPMFYFGLKDISNAWLWWIIDIGTLAFVIYNLHKGEHKL